MALGKLPEAGPAREAWLKSAETLARSWNPDPDGINETRMAAECLQACAEIRSQDTDRASHRCTKCGYIGECYCACRTERELREKAEEKLLAAQEALAVSHVAIDSLRSALQTARKWITHHRTCSSLPAADRPGPCDCSYIEKTKVIDFALEVK